MRLTFGRIVGPAAGLARITGVLVLAALVSGCAGPASPPPVAVPAPQPAEQPAETAAASPVSLTVFAAASLRDALDAAAAAYRDTTGNTIVPVTDSSTALRTQIEQGAHADVFLSADTKNPDALAAAGLVDGTVIAFAGNQLAIVVPKDNPARIASPFDLGRPGVKVIAAGDSVPISTYAATLLARLAALPGAPADLEAAYAANVVSREDNVKAALAKVELGEGDVAIVYSSDASASSAVSTVEIPPDAQVVATYAGAVPTTADQPSAGHAFLDWLAGPDGQAILAGFGFITAS